MPRRSELLSMAEPGDFEVIRDPLWNNIRVDTEALAVLDSAPFQRLRYIRQLGHAYLVYPGATHTRFEHALGAYHLARRTLVLLRERGELDGIDPDEIVLVLLAALLHDIGHYPFSHALEEAGLPSHETLAAVHLHQAELETALSNTGIADVESRLVALISGTSRSPLGGLISGSLDLDKIEYLTRDARSCGVPYGTVDVDRLLHSITLVSLANGAKTVALHEKGVSALESLLFAKYQMYRNVYWHHAVRSATAMFKRLVRTAIKRGDLEAQWIAHATDEALMATLRMQPNTPLPVRLWRRRLYKRVLDLPAAQVPDGAGAWIADDPDLVERVEDHLATEQGLKPGELLIDFPAKPEMLAVDLLIRPRRGQIEQWDSPDGAARLGIHRVSHELHTSARRLRVFTAEPIALNQRAMLSLVERRAVQVVEELEGGGALLSARS